jgi:antitoxin component of RelBE/YafQ-DinJ toxin-antitoxin module
MSVDTKLTVRVERDLIEVAKRYAKQQGITLSQLIEDYLRSLAIQQDEPMVNTPVLQRLSGILPTSTRLDEYHRHLEDKYD